MPPTCLDLDSPMWLKIIPNSMVIGTTQMVIPTNGVRRTKTNVIIPITPPAVAIPLPWGAATTTVVAGCIITRFDLPLMKISPTISDNSRFFSLYYKPMSPKFHTKICDYREFDSDEIKIVFRLKVQRAGFEPANR